MTFASVRDQIRLTGFICSPVACTSGTHDPSPKLTCVSPTLLSSTTARLSCSPLSHRSPREPATQPNNGERSHTDALDALHRQHQSTSSPAARLPL